MISITILSTGILFVVLSYVCFHSNKIREVMPVFSEITWFGAGIILFILFVAAEIYGFSLI